MDLMICEMCGVQYDTRSATSCKVCDDPRQFVPPDGQSWTTLREMQRSKKYTNVFKHDKHHSGIISIFTQPQVAIGQRAFLLCSPRGNILWDCLTYIDDATVQHIKDLGGVEAIVISHPHYYSTSAHWAQELGCNVYLSVEDEEWVMRRTTEVKLWRGRVLDLLDHEFTAVKVGGHFPGSSVMYWPREKKLFVADSITVIPSGVYHVDRQPNTSSFTFMWSYPNMIPLPPDEIHNVWRAVKELDFEDTHGAFWNRDTRGESKKRMLESAQLMIRFMGHEDHAIQQETL